MRRWPNWGWDLLGERIKITARAVLSFQNPGRDCGGATFILQFNHQLRQENRSFVVESTLAGVRFRKSLIAQSRGL